MTRPEPDIALPPFDRFGAGQPFRVVAGPARRVMQHQPVTKMDQRMVDDIAENRRQRDIPGGNLGIGGKAQET